MTRDLVRLISLISLGVLATSLLLPLGAPCRADDDSAEPAMKTPTLDKPAETPHPPATPPATVPATQPPAKGTRPRRPPSRARADARVGGLQRSRPGRPGSAPSGRVQHPRQLRHRDHEYLPRVRLRDRDHTIDGRRKPTGQRHHLPLLELSLRRLPIAHGPARPRRRPDRLRLPGASRRVPGHAGHVARPGRLRPARGAECAQGFGPRRDRKTALAGAAKTCRWCSSAWPTTPTSRLGRTIWANPGRSIGSSPKSSRSRSSARRKAA